MKRIVLIFACVLALTIPVSGQQISTGSIGALEGVVLAQPPPNQGSLLIQVTGTWAATLTFEGSVDGTNYVALDASNVTTGSTTTTTTANGVFAVSGSGLRFFRVRASLYTSGTAVVTIAAGPGGGAGGGGGGGGASGDVNITEVGGNAVTTTLPVSGTLTAVTTVGTITNPVTVAQATAANLNATVVGTLANDGVAAATNRIGTLPGLVETSAPTRTNGRNAGFSFLAGGGARVVITNDAGASQTLSTDATADSAALITGPQDMALGKNTTLPTAVTDGDAVRMLADLQGRLRPKNVCADPELVSSVVISTASSGNVELVAISGTTVPVVCGFNVIAGGTVGVQFIVGTGTACATNELNKTGVYPLIVNSGINSGFGAPIFKGAAGDAVCVELSAAVQIDGILTYVSVSVP